MKKDGRKKLMPVAIALSLLLTIVVLVPQSFAAVETYVSRTEELTYGDTIWVNVSGLTPGNDYEVYIEDGDGGWETGFGEEEADSFGRVSIEVEVPYRHDLGDYDLELWDVTDDPAVEEADTLTSIEIYNTYQVKMFVGDDEVDYLLHNFTYDSEDDDTTLMFKFYNGTNLIDDWDLDIYLYVWDGDSWEEKVEPKMDLSNGVWALDWLVADELVDLPNFEYYYWLEVDPTDDAEHADEYTEIPIDVKLDVTVNSPSDVTYGDEDVDVAIYVKDYDSDDPDANPAGVAGYTVSLYSPNDGGYDQIDSQLTVGAHGKYTFTFDTTDGHAGTWYVGTEEASPEDIKVYTNLYGRPGIADFIPYGSFTVGTKTDGKLEVNSPSEFVAGFDIEDGEMNVSIYEPDYDEAAGDYYDEMEFHFQGVDCYYNGVEYESDDLVPIDFDYDGLSSNEKTAYYLIDDIICFNETGTVTIIATWPDSYVTYSSFENPDLEPDISTSTTFTVVAAEEMTMIVDDMVEDVLLEDADGCGYKNTSTTITIHLFGETQDEPMNAGITIAGCGLDISFDEEDAVDDGYWQAEGVYEVDVSPKTAGTITITATNDTEEKSVSRDFSVNGLSGSVTTSAGDDLEIDVQSSEIITITTNPSSEFADVYLTYFDEDWEFLECLNDTVGENEPGNGEDGEYEFTILSDDIEDGVGYIVVAVNDGTRWMYDIVEVAAVKDLEIEFTSPANATDLYLTVGLEHTYKLKVYDADGNLLEDIAAGDVVGKIIDADHDEDDPLQEVTFTEKSGSIWQISDWIPYYAGTFVITATNDTGVNEHYANTSLMVDLATITYSPDTLTAGIEQEDVEITVSGVDANGEVLPDGTVLILNVENDTGGFDMTDTEVTLDEDGIGEFTVDCVGDLATWINLTFLEEYNADKNGNKTSGQLTIAFPYFEVEPDVISSELNSAKITVTAKVTDDADSDLVSGINITFVSTFGNCIEVPDPIMTDENGQAVFTIVPLSSGKANVTIVQGLEWTDGAYDWDDVVYTPSTLTVTRQTLDVTLSATKVYAGGSFTVTVEDDGTPVAGADVTFDGTTTPTNANGVVTFEADSPGVESYQYTITVEKSGYPDATATILVIDTYQITISGPSSKGKGETFTVTVVANTKALAGATVTFNGNEATSDNDGKASFKAPDKTGTYTVTATYDDERYVDGSLEIKITEGGTPGFELLTLIIAIGVAFILLRRRRK